MKELSIEQKAKAYNGLIERLKDLKFAYRFSPLSDTIEEKFPELKENNNEKVKVKLIEFFKGYSPDKEWWGNITQEDILAWFEKQGEQNPAEWSEEDEDILNTIINHFKIDIECTDEDDIVRWLKSLKDRVQPQPKQEWSLKEDAFIQVCVNAINDISYFRSEDKEELINWLKSLKDRMKGE